jgi:hypothetical protein
MNDEEFLRQFETCGLTHAEWTHRAHVKTAYLFLRRYPFTEALSRLRKGIQALNAAHRIEESPTRGYNETTTRAYVQLIAATMKAYEERS